MTIELTNPDILYVRYALKQFIQSIEENKFQASKETKKNLILELKTIFEKIGESLDFTDLILYLKEKEEKAKEKQEEKNRRYREWNIGKIIEKEKEKEKGKHLKVVLDNIYNSSW